MDSARLFFFGTPRIECDGKPVKIDRRKALALFTYLACTGVRHSREALAALLWPETEAKHAFAYLRNAVWVLKRMPLSECFEVRRDSIAFKRTDRVQVDVHRFKQLISASNGHEHCGEELCSDCLSALRQAVVLYTADFLAGFTLPDSPSFDEWQFAEGEELRRVFAQTLERLVVHYNAVHDFGSAIHCAQKWVALDPLHEVAHRHLLSAYALSGQRNRALKQYKECASILERELGAVPDDETDRLVEQIRSGALDRPKGRHRKKSPQNIPSPPTPFIGRANELRKVERLLDEPECRLLSIVGVGGSGKTRLAIEVAKHLVNDYLHGACFVSLAPVTTPEFVALATVDALPQPLLRKDATASVDRSEEGVTPEAVLVRYLSDKRMLLVFDNMDHLVGAVDLIVEILEKSPGVKVLVTSRQRLHVRQEWVFDLVGLRYPTTDVPTEASSEYGAVELFMQCARRTEAGFHPTGDEAAAVLDICRLLEGIPLGIELAASWVQTLSCREIAAEITANIDFLTTSIRDFPDRHRSLRVVFDQSWRLLPPDGRICFRKLAVFRGGFTRSAAEQVAGATVSALSSLVDKSMLRRSSSNRYELLEVLRQFAEERLLSVPRERDVIRDRHARHYLGVLKQAEADLKGPGLKNILLLLREELGNIRAAWRWGSQREMLPEIREAATSLFLFYDIGSRYEEGAEMFREAGRILGDPPSEERGDTVGFLAAAQAWFIRFSSPRDCEALLKRSMDYLEPYREQSFAALPTMMAAFSGLEVPPISMEERLQDYLTILNDAGDSWGIAMALEALTFRCYKTDPEVARSLAQQSLEIRLALGDQWGKALSLFILGKGAELRGDYETARRRYAESREVREELGEDQEGTLECIAGVGRVSCYLGDYSAARQTYSEGLHVAEEIANHYRSSCFKLSLSMVSFLQDELDEAMRLARACLAAFEDLGNTSGIADSLALLGFCFLRRGNREDALSYFERCLLTEADHPLALIGLGDLYLHQSKPESALGTYQKALVRARNKGTIPLVLRAMVGIAQAFSAQGSIESAAELVGFVSNHRGLHHDLRRRLVEFMPDVREALPESELESAMTRGAGFDLDTAIRKADVALASE